MIGELVPFPVGGGGISTELGRASAERLLDLSADERVSSVEELHAAQPETLLSLCQLIEERISASPAKAFEDARWAYTFLDDNPSAHAFLFDEREYYLGELALLTGIAARLMGQR